MSGINAISVYGKEALIPVISKELSNIIPIFNVLMPALTAILTTILMKRLGRKFFIQFGTVTACFCELIIFIGFLIDDQYKVASPILISIGMIVYMANLGFSFGSVLYLYAPEIVEPHILPYSSMANLLGAAICILVFPIIKDALPNQDPDYLFLFFFTWCLVSIFINWKCMVETKDKSREQIFEEYHRLKVC